MGKREAAMDWTTMSRDERDRAFNNLAHVGAAAAQAKREEWTAASQTLRASQPGHLDLAYADAERTAWDLYPAADPAATCLVHIHGGYWQRGSREGVACLVAGALAAGWSAALPGYTLAPEASLTQIVAELRTAFDWLAAEAPGHGIAGPVIVTGWSAGGHLAALLLDHPRVTAGVAISGLFELGPLRDVPHVNDQVQLTDTEVATLSPQRLPGLAKPLALAYGTAELPGLVASSRDFHACRAAAHLPGELVPIARANHFTVLDGLRKPDSLLTRAVLRMAEHPAA